MLVRFHIDGCIHQARLDMRGDRIPLGEFSDTALRDVRAELSLDLSRAVTVLPGHDGERFEADALTTLVGHPFTILSTSDRTGARLDGPPLRRKGDDLGRSSPMVRGAIQVPRSGSPIVLGPDHPTTGGYPVLAVVARADVGQLFARPLGATVRFALPHGP